MSFFSSGSVEFLRIMLFLHRSPERSFFLCSQILGCMILQEALGHEPLGWRVDAL
ncbi:MAG: hypothetical protein GX261_09645 [Spirochaetales bacterium]|nr:hypothetical protein [Spirochaetota bacterium]NLL25723.1 hypothetical protein [Spirochaetales bacterium]